MKHLVIMIVCLSTLFFSCKKEQEMKISQNEVKESTNSRASSTISSPTASATATTYAVTPTVGNYSANSSSSITLSGTCGNYSGGIIKAQIISQSGSTFTIRISKQNGSTFGVAGTAKVKSSSVCGGLAGSASYSMLNYSVDVTINATFAQGVAHFYPVIESSTGGTKCYAEPIMVYTLPSYASGPYSEGMLLATVDGVNLYASGISLTGSNLNYQCTRFCNNYYSQVYGMNIVNTGTNGGNANTWFANASAKGLSAFTNGGSTGPRVGDVLCLSGGSGGYGHVGIITEVSSTQVKMANQNGGTGSFYPIGWTLSRSGNTVSSPSGYTVQGWLRKP